LSLKGKLPWLTKICSWVLRRRRITSRNNEKVLYIQSHQERPWCIYCQSHFRDGKVQAQARYLLKAIQPLSRRTEIWASILKPGHYDDLLLPHSELNPTDNFIC
jgi:hypothetical protein